MTYANLVVHRFHRSEVPNYKMILFLILFCYISFTLKFNFHSQCTSTLWVPIIEIETNFNILYIPCSGQHQCLQILSSFHQTCQVFLLSEMWSHYSSGIIILHIIKKFRYNLCQIFFLIITTQLTDSLISLSFKFFLSASICAKDITEISISQLMFCQVHLFV